MACALAVVALITACSTGESPVVEDAGDNSATAHSRTRGVEPTSTDPALAVPEEASGPLDARSVPAASSLGAGWSAFIDPGAAADGYVGNASFVRERDGAELVASLIPLGCADMVTPPTLPRPQYALEATYRHEDGSAAVVIVLDFAEEDAARALILGLGAAVAACPPAAADSGPESLYRLEIEVIHRSADVLHDVRRETGEGASPSRWVEVAIRAVRRVALAVIEVQVDGSEPDLDGLSAHLGEALRTS